MICYHDKNIDVKTLPPHGVEDELYDHNMEIIKTLRRKHLGFNPNQAYAQQGN